MNINNIPSEIKNLIYNQLDIQSKHLVSLVNKDCLEAIKATDLHKMIGDREQVLKSWFGYLVTLNNIKPKTFFDQIAKSIFTSLPSSNAAQENEKAKLTTLNNQFHRFEVTGISFDYPHFDWNWQVQIHYLKHIVLPLVRAQESKLAEEMSWQHLKCLAMTCDCQIDITTHYNELNLSIPLLHEQYNNVHTYGGKDWYNDMKARLNSVTASKHANDIHVISLFSEMRSWEPRVEEGIIVREMDMHGTMHICVRMQQNFRFNGWKYLKFHEKSESKPLEENILIDKYGQVADINLYNQLCELVRSK